MRDFFNIMKELNLYNVKNHNKTERMYRFPNGSTVEFFATIDDQKLRGRKRDVLYMNEANEISFGEFNQLALRTTGTIFIDYNPSDTESYLYDLLKDEEKSILIKSTYKDNPFLQKEQIEYIESLINVDENWYKIYALGERPISESRIYSHFKLFSDRPKSTDWCYGLDFGFNHPTALVRTTFIDNAVYVEEILYKQKLTVSELVNEVRLLVRDAKPIYCDTARPEIISELRNAGLMAKEANKSVKEGINAVKSSQIFIDVNASNILKEYKLYSWKMKGELVTDEVVKLNDDAMDALRYAIFSHQKKKFNSKGATIFVPIIPKDDDDW
jgi:phage terminase large subunit